MFWIGRRKSFTAKSILQLSQRKESWYVGLWGRMENPTQYVSHRQADMQPLPSDQFLPISTHQLLAFLFSAMLAYCGRMSWPWLSPLLSGLAWRGRSAGKPTVRIKQTQPHHAICAKLRRGVNQLRDKNGGKWGNLFNICGNICYAGGQAGGLPPTWQCTRSFTQAIGGGHLECQSKL